MSYITTYTRNHFNPVHPEAEKIDIQDIAHALSLAVNEVIRNTIAGRRVNSTSQLTIEKAGVVCYDKKD